MGSSAVAAHEYWGNHLIKPDKTPTPVFEQLLLGVANYINRHVAPWDVNCLTPAKLAAFYRLVGGDYDALFLETEEASLSFIYQSLGCFHSLQPERNPYVAPRIPALTPHGFVRWQTIQLLLEPEEHVPFLQDAVKRFKLINPADGLPFPSILPRETLPTQPDPEMIDWYATVSEKLRLEAQASSARDLPSRPPKLALSDVDVESSRDSSVDSHFVTGYHPGARNTQHAAPMVNGQPSVHIQPRYTNDMPWSPERRRNSLPDNRQWPASWSHHGPTPTTSRSFSQLPTRNTRPPHVRVPSDVSTLSTSTDDSSSVPTSSPSMSPVRFHTQLNPPMSPGTRRHSTAVPPQRPASHPQGFFSHQRQPPGQHTTKNVKWQDIKDIKDVSDRPSSNQSAYGARDYRSSSARGARPGDKEWEDRGRGRSTGSSIGVGGRRYPEGVRWR